MSKETVDILTYVLIGLSLLMNTIYIIIEIKPKQR